MFLHNPFVCVLIGVFNSNQKLICKMNFEITDIWTHSVLDTSWATMSLTYSDLDLNTLTHHDLPQLLNIYRLPVIFTPTLASDILPLAAFWEHDSQVFLGKEKYLL